MIAVRTMCAFGLLAVVGCKGSSDTGGDTSLPVTDTQTDPTPALDGDGDGITEADGDCDDGNPNVFPGRLEDCNGVDDNCNGVLDEGTADADADGTCDALDVEECDGLDNDGDGRVDEDFGDADHDGIADCADGEECDGVDNNGDGVVDEGYDADGDSYSQCGEDAVRDCDDGDASVNPGSAEQSGDLVDNDCDGTVDEGDWAAGDLVITEVMRNPAAVGDPSGEWFEVYNASGRTLALNGLVVADAAVDWHQIASASVVTMEPGGYAVLGGNGDRISNGGVTMDYVYTGVSLGNARDDLVLWIVDGGDALVVDEVSWGNDFPAPSGASMSLDPQLVDVDSNDAAGSWCSASAPWASLSELGSPGEANELCVTIDHDGDGVTLADGDCDDEDGGRYPGAPELDVALDEDCDGVAELGAVAVASLGPSSSEEECGLLQLNGASSYDPDGAGPFTYEWMLSSAPAASALSSEDIDDADRSVAWFEPDVSGTYVFSLVVRDGGGAAGPSAEVEVEVAGRVANNAPVADAGGSIIDEATIACNGATLGLPFACKPCADATIQLDGAATLDPDGDSVSYRWTLLSGNGSLLDETSETPTVLVTGPAPDDIGETAREVVYVALEVTDCMGATSTQDVITVAYECTGVSP